MRSYRLLFAAVLLLLSCRATEAQNVVIDLRRPEALKDLSRCALGAGEGSPTAALSTPIRWARGAPSSPRRCGRPG